jgi:hypothetical protein
VLNHYTRCYASPKSIRSSTHYLNDTLIRFGVWRKGPSSKISVGMSWGPSRWQLMWKLVVSFGLVSETFAACCCFYPLRTLITVWSLLPTSYAWTLNLDWNTKCICKYRKRSILIAKHSTYSSLFNIWSILSYQIRALMKCVRATSAKISILYMVIKEL